MLEEQGVVLEIEGDEARIETQRQGACESCKARSGCGQKLLNERKASRAFVVSVRNPRQLALAPGDRVVLGLEESSLLLASLTVYLLPLIGVIGAAVIADLLGFSEALVAVAALGGLFAGLGWVKLRARSATVTCRFQPELLRKIA